MQKYEQGECTERENAKKKTNKQEGSSKQLPSIQSKKKVQNAPCYCVGMTAH